MYTHARQFPHFTGRRDDEIRDLARRAMSRHPRLMRVMRIRNRSVLLGMAIAVATLYSNHGAESTANALVRIGILLFAAGASSTVFLLGWNLIWLNTVVFRITRAEVERVNT